MQNAIHLIDVTPVREECGAIFAPIEPFEQRLRLVRIFSHQAMTDPRNARAARKKALRRAPDWVQQRVVRDEPVHEFKLANAARRELERVRDDIRCLAEAAARPPQSDDGRGLQWAIHAFLDDIAKMRAEDVAARAAKLAETVRKVEAGSVLLAALLSGEPLPTPSGRVWRPLLERAALWAVGEALRNCLRQGSSFHYGYETQLEEGESSFWALCADERPLAVAQIHCKTGVVTQFRAERNAGAGAYSKDLAVLLEARGYKIPCDWSGGRVTLDAAAFRLLIAGPNDPKPL
jgi:predicted transcriptional regulator